MPSHSKIATKECTLPDLLALCPFKGSTNPYHTLAAAESAAWLDSYNVFTGRKREHFRMSCFELLASKAYPYADHDKLRMCCDLINLLSVVDEICDDQTGDGAHRLSKQYLLALNGGPVDESLISRITKDFRGRLVEHITPHSNVMRRYLQASQDTVSAIAQEAKLRERSNQLETSEFVDFRRKNSAILVCFPFIELALGIELPDEVFEDHDFQNMVGAAADAIAWTNDICSYCREAAKGIAGINIITVLMRNEEISLQEAMDHSGRLLKQRIDDFLQGKAAIRSFETCVDSDVRAYIMGLEQWMIGSTNWCFDAGRFFGLDVDSVKRTCVVKFQQIMSADVMNY